MDTFFFAHDHDWTYGTLTPAATWLMWYGTESVCFSGFLSLNSIELPKTCEFCDPAGMKSATSKEITGMPREMESEAATCGLIEEKTK